MPDHRPEQTDLSAAAARGHRAAFDALHDRFAAGLLRLFLLRTGGRQDLAEDLAQRTWMTCWRSLAAGKYDPARAAFSTYLYAIGGNIWREHLRAAGRAAELGPPDALGAVEDSGNPEDWVRLAETLDALRSCLSGEDGGDLTEDDRWILRAVADGASDRDMARRLGLAPSTMNVRKRAAFDRLRRWLASRGHRLDLPERPAPGGQ